MVLMSVKEIRELYSAAPFKPFEVVVTNGIRLYVPHPEFMMFSQDFRTVYISRPEGGSDRVDVKLIVAIDDSPKGVRRRKRKG
ncbi:MAG: hypothetical protein DLM52_07800 [Chthoniobacterales bacterium]|nr:MAG: hypothetical protein DLM52_07800 [Chthoniobacterales bacterium]